MVDQSDGDLALFNDRAFGEIFVENGEPRMDQGLGTAVFISLFSGKGGRFWGNELSNDEDSHYGGEFEALAEGLDVSVANVLLMQEAILNDLEWMKSKSLAVNIEVASSIVNGEQVNFTLAITRPDEESPVQFNFSTNWNGQFDNPAHIGIE